MCNYAMQGCKTYVINDDCAEQRQLTVGGKRGKEKIKVYTQGLGTDLFIQK